MYNKIVNPETGRKVSIYSSKGKLILKKYMQLGGFVRGGVRIPPSNYLDTNVNCNVQNGGFIRGGVRIPPSNYLDTDVNCNVQNGGFIRGGGSGSYRTPEEEKKFKKQGAVLKSLYSSGFSKFKGLNPFAAPCVASEQKLDSFHTTKLDTIFPPKDLGLQTQLENILDALERRETSAAWRVEKAGASTPELEQILQEIAKARQDLDKNLHDQIRKYKEVFRADHRIRNKRPYEGWAFRPRWDIDSSSSEYVIKDIETFGQLRDLIDNYYGDYCGMTHSVLGSLQR